MSQIADNIGVMNYPFLRKLTMLVLSLSPLLMWYSINLPISLGVLLVLIMSAIAFVVAPFRFNVLPFSFYIVFLYVSIIWVVQNGLSFSTIIPPGGNLFSIFVISLIGGILFFDYKALKKCMKWVVWTSVACFWIQYIVLQLLGISICLVPNLTGQFIYNGYSYADVLAFHTASKYPCAFFLEKSYMGYYIVAYLSLLFFESPKKNNFFSFEAVIIMITLLFLRSGSGLLGIAVVATVKVFMLYRNWNEGKRIIMILLVVPMLISVFFIFRKSEIGLEMLNRQNELSTEGTSGYARIAMGYVIYGGLPQTNKLIGIKGDNLISNDDSNYNLNNRLYLNGVQMILVTLGLIGLLLYVLFYGTIYRKGNSLVRMSIITLLFMSLLEANYLNMYMVLMTVIPCGLVYSNQKHKSLSSWSNLKIKKQ